MEDERFFRPLFKNLKILPTHMKIETRKGIAYFPIEITDEKLYDFSHLKEVMSKLKSHIYHVTQLPNHCSSASERYSADCYKS